MEATCLVVTQKSRGQYLVCQLDRKGSNIHGVGCLTTLLHVRKGTKMKSNDMPAYMRDRRHSNREFALTYLGAACVKCGLEDPEKLEFDHVDPSTKTMTIADMLAHGRERLIEELQKCQILCEEHHLEKSIANGDIGLFGPANGMWVEALHGTNKMYHVHKCKCEECRSWKRAYRNKEVDARGNPR